MDTMQYSCLHTHTIFCDGHDDIETICRSAYGKGLFAIGFSAHAPIHKKTGFQSDWHLRDDRLEEYLDAVNTARRRWEGRLQVFLGLEVDYIPGLMGPADQDLHELGLDYSIGSVHYVVPPRGKPFTVDDAPKEFETGIREGFAGDGTALMEAYWDTVEAMIRAGGFDILGHVDLVKKNTPQGQWFSLEGAPYCRRIAGVAGLIAETVTGSPWVVEVNTGGLNRVITQDTYPSLPFLRLLNEKQVPVIITADAHRAADVDGHYQTARETLLAAGYAHAVLFGGRKGGLPVWIREPL
ncbi:MAG: histidinol-phosphatase [Treponema sp.]|jgi:histidinol-phosphatase (PHP family)|nr:histidinol-phosphatase [Treponema sp.]